MDEKDLRQDCSTIIERVLELARWAPSGDNTQPWRFEIIDNRHVVVHAHDTRAWCLYDLRGRASQTAVGALLETIAIAASLERLDATFKRRPDAPDTNPVIDVYFSESTEINAHPLLPFVKTRVTQRRPFATTPLATEMRAALEKAVGPGFEVKWIEGQQQRWRMAKLLFRSGHIRLTIPEAYEVHKRIIEWDARFSEDRIPDSALGIDQVTVRLMRWAMERWTRILFLNRYLAGTWLPRIQLDLIPARQCAAHFVIVSDGPLDSIDDYLAGGRAMQRFWLTATSLGLQFQPEMTPLIFSTYIRQGIKFTKSKRAILEAESVKRRLDEMVGEKAIAGAVFMGRLGLGDAPLSRSMRLPLSSLLYTHEQST